MSSMVLTSRLICVCLLGFALNVIIPDCAQAGGDQEIAAPAACCLPAPATSDLRDSESPADLGAAASACAGGCIATAIPPASSMAAAVTARPPPRYAVLQWVERTETPDPRPPRLSALL